MCLGCADQMRGAALTGEGFPDDSAGEEPACNVGDLWGLSSGLRRSLEKRTATNSGILVEKLHGLYSPWGLKESDMTEQLSLT